MFSLAAVLQSSSRRRTGPWPWTCAIPSLQMPGKTSHRLRDLAIWLKVRSESLEEILASVIAGAQAAES
jgi:hypothetical protein